MKRIDAIRQRAEKARGYSAYFRANLSADVDWLTARHAEMVGALNATLPNLMWANIHGSRCDEIISAVRDAISKAGEE